MADAATGDDADFNPTYSGLKKASLLTSTLLLLLSLPSVTVSGNLTFLGVVVTGMNIDAIRFGMLACSLMYTLHFLNAWLQDGASYMRRSKDKTGDLIARTNAEMVRTANAVSLLTEQAVEVKNLVEAVVHKVNGDGVVVDWAELLRITSAVYAETKERAAKDVAQNWHVFLQPNSDGQMAQPPDLPQDRAIEAFPFVSEIFRQVIHEAFNSVSNMDRWNGILVGHSNLPLLQSRLEVIEQRSIAATEAAHSELSRIRTDLWLGGRFLPSMRVLVWDLFPVLIAASMGWCHYVGRVWWTPLPDAVTVLQAIHFIPKPA